MPSTSSTLDATEGPDVSDLINALRDAATNPEKARQALADLGGTWSQLTEEQRAQAMDVLSGLSARASQLSGEQREQAAELLGLVRGRLSTLPEDARSQVSALLSRFTT